MNKLYRYLKARCITQVGFAKMIGSTPANLNRILSGKGLPSVTLAYKIEKASGGAIKMKDWVIEEPKATKVLGKKTISHAFMNKKN